MVELKIIIFIGYCTQCSLHVAGMIVYRVCGDGVDAGMIVYR